MFFRLIRLSVLLSLSELNEKRILIRNDPDKIEFTITAPVMFGMTFAVSRPSNRVESDLARKVFTVKERVSPNVETERGSCRTGCRRSLEARCCDMYVRWLPLSCRSRRAVIRAPSTSETVVVAVWRMTCSPAARQACWLGAHVA